MSGDQIVVFVTLAVAVILFVWDRIRMDLVALLALSSLLVFGILEAPEALAGFSDPVVVMIAALFIVGEGLFRTGVAGAIGRLPLRLGGSSPRRLLAVVMLLVAGLSAFMSSTGTVAVMLPVVVGIAERLSISPSKLLLPLSIASLLGGMLTLIGTPPNLVVSNALVAQGLEPFGFFDFTPVGLVMLVLGVIFVLVFGDKLLPSRAPVAKPRHAPSVRELAETWALAERTRRVEVRPESPLIGRTLGESELRAVHGLTVLDIKRAPRRRRLPKDDGPEPDSTEPETRFCSGDVLFVDATPEAIEAAGEAIGLELLAADEAEDRLPAEVGLVEVILTPRSVLLGRTLAEIRFRHRFHVNVAAMRRLGQPVEGSLAHVPLQFGDTLLVEGPWEAIDALRAERDDLVVAAAPPELEKALAPTGRAKVAVALLVAMLLGLTFGWLPPAVVVLLTALAMVLTGCVAVPRIYRAVNWPSVVLIAAILPMATALDRTGGMALVVDAVVTGLGDAGPRVVLVALFLLTSIASQVISNTATSVLVAPIAIGLAQALGVAPYPLLMTVAIAASTAFATPVASPVNTLVLGPGQYRFVDFARVGVPMQLVLLVATVFVVPLFFPF